SVMSVAVWGLKKAGSFMLPGCSSMKTRITSTWLSAQLTNQRLLLVYRNEVLSKIFSGVRDGRGHAMTGADSQTNQRLGGNMSLGPKYDRLPFSNSFSPSEPHALPSLLPARPCVPFFFLFQPYCSL